MAALKMVLHLLILKFQHGFHFYNGRVSNVIYAGKKRATSEVSLYIDLATQPENINIKRNRKRAHYHYFSGA